jgi:prophage tail gpP-like protein
MVFRTSDVATLTVNGQEYRDWKTVTVYLCFFEANNYYRFTCTEGKPLAQKFSEMRIRPGDACTVYLGDKFAIGGVVTTRQVAYTATHHGVEITGKSDTFATVSGTSVVEGGEMQNVSYTVMASNLLKPYGLTFEPKGNISQKKIPRVSTQGQSVWDVLESNARALNIHLGTSPDRGDSYWGTDPSYTEGYGQAIEGLNILEGREIISKVFSDGPSVSTSQMAPTPEKWGAVATQISSSVTSGFADMAVAAGPFMPLLQHLEVPGDKANAQMRSNAENVALSYDRLMVEVVLQGWFNQSGALWKPKNIVYVKSPMLIMDRNLQCKSVTFTQDDRSGTRTTLELTDENVGKPKVDT